ncbi:MAG: helix-turn-helix domain-containing protein [Clostridiales bacterium]|nr:helix-turn-helix domain-containing protein [Clostridiales bacterium]
MAARLTDEQIKKIIADYLELESYNAAAKRNDVSPNTVKKYVREDEAFAQKCKQKKEQNTADIMAYMEGKTALVCEIIGKGLEVLASDEKLAEASPAQITTAIGTLIDKWTGLNQANAGQEKAASRLFAALEQEEKP